MNDLRQAATALLEYLHGYDADYPEAAPIFNALRAALAEPQTTHWEGCEAVHPECRKQEPDGISWLKRDSGYFTAPTFPKPLTDEEMRECAQAMNAEPLAEGWPELIKFARAIERAHGIGEQHE